jgi:hypothetical protein
MITYDLNDVKSLPFIDVGRPFIRKEDIDGRREWLEFHKLIESSKISIGVNSAYKMIDSVLKDPEGQYYGGGFKYQFWFKTDEDLMVFVRECRAKAIGFNFPKRPA